MGGLPGELPIPTSPDDVSDLPPEQQEEVAALREWGLANLGEPVTVIIRGVPVSGEIVRLGILVYGDLIVLWRTLVTDDRIYLDEPGFPKSVIIDGEALYWPHGGVVPWSIGIWAGTTTGANIEAAIAQWQGISGVRFVRRTNEPDYLIFGDSMVPDLCLSSVGGVGVVGRFGGPQWVLLRPSGGCSENPAITHEIGHVIGHHHAHQRTDAVLTVSSVMGCRNDATTFAQCGIGPCQETGGDDCGCHNMFGSNFTKCVNLFGNWAPVSGLGVTPIGAWDQNAIMHYIPTAFARDDRSVFALQPGANPGQNISAQEASVTRSMYVRWNDSLERNRGRPGNTYQTWPQAERVGVNGDAAAERCNRRCARASSCMAYEVVNVSGGSECRLKNVVGNSVAMSGAVTAIVRPGYEVGYDRLGSDLGSIVTTSAAACRQLCVGGTGCDSFTFVAGPNRCYLKSGTPAPTATCSTCTSGLVRSSGQEYGIDLTGGDYNVFPMDYPEYGMCRRTCEANTQCVAWTYADPTQYSDVRARCWLKSSIGSRVSNVNTVSGVR